MHEEKIRAANAAAELVKDGMLVGLGSGTTAELAIRAVASRMRTENLRIRGIPTSERSGKLAEDLGIPLVGDGDADVVDLTIDGADEVDPSFNMIKGHGGALLREKLVARASQKVAIVIDSSKLVDELGATRIPIEVPRFGWEFVNREIQPLGAVGQLRRGANGPFVTDNGNYIIDAKFDRPFDAYQLDRRLRELPGVIVTGLFLDLLDYLYIGHKDAETEIRSHERQAARSSSF